jgi:hypothetical protein
MMMLIQHAEPGCILLNAPERFGISCKKAEYYPGIIHADPLSTQNPDRTRTWSYLKSRSRGTYHNN